MLNNRCEDDEWKDYYEWGHWPTARSVVTWLARCHPNPDTYILKFMIKSQRCWWSWWHEMRPPP